MLLKQSEQTCHDDDNEEVEDGHASEGDGNGEDD